MEDIYYVDRPSIPATQQNIIHLNSIIEHALPVGAEKLNPNYCAHAAEVRNSEGEIDGTLLYFTGVTFAELTSGPIDEEAEVEVEAELSRVYAEPVENFLSDTPPPPEAEANFNAESKLIDLDMELSEAKHHVWELEDEIATLEKEAYQ